MLTLVAAVLVASPLLGSPPKCGQNDTIPGYEDGSPVVLVDGDVFEGGLGGIDALDVHSIHVTCWDPKTNSFDVSPAIPLVRVLTKALVRATEHPLEQLAVAQGHFVEGHSRPAGDLEALRDFGLPKSPALEYRASATEWTAATPDGLVAYRCFVSQKLGEAGDFSAAEISCEPSPEKALASMRTLYGSPR